MFGFSTCDSCRCGGEKHTDTVKVSLNSPAELCDKENEVPSAVNGQEAELQQAAADERRRLEREEEDRRRAREEEQEAERQRQRELERLQVLEHQRLEELARQRRLKEEQKAREEEQLRQQEKAEALRQAEETRRGEQLGLFLSRHGFASVNERKKIKGGMLSSASAYPLHVAVRATDAQAVGLLLWGGADKTLQDSAKLTPMALAHKLNKNGSHKLVIDTLAG